MLSLIRREEEESVFPDRSTNRNPKLIHPHRWLDPVGRIRVVVGEERICVQGIIAQKPPRAPMEVIRAGLGDETGHCTGATAKFS